MDIEVYNLVRYRGKRKPGSPLPVVDAGRDTYVVVEEFSTWAITVPTQPQVTPLILFGEQEVALEWAKEAQGYVWPSGKVFEYKDRTAGKLTFYYRNSRGELVAFDTRLYIIAANISDKDFVQLLARLKQLAISTSSAVTAPIEDKLPVGLGHSEEWHRTPMTRRALALLHFQNVLESQWPLISRAPATQARRVLSRVSTTSKVVQRSEHALRQMTRQPGRFHLWLPHLTETADTPENRFLAFALRNFVEQVQQLSENIDGEIQSFNAVQLDKLDVRDFNRREQEAGGEKWEIGQSEMSRKTDAYKELAQNLATAQEWANRQLRNSWLSAAAKHPSLPIAPSLRLTRSPGYSVVYRAYRQIFGSDKTEIRLAEVRRALTERTVHRTQKLYEIWLFLEVYKLLTQNFGFESVGEQPADHLFVREGYLQLESGHKYKLKLRLENDLESIYLITLSYEPAVRYPACTVGKSCYDNRVCSNKLGCYFKNSATLPLGPDVVIETVYGDNKLRFAVDAKYRDYVRMPLLRNEFKKYGLVSNYQADVLGTAKMKYYNGTVFDAAFIVHSDPRPQYVFWGEEAFQAMPHREQLIEDMGYKLTMDEEYPAHRYGAVFALPSHGDQGQLRRLLYCLLMYHAGWNDICWVCRRRIAPKKYAGWAGDYYECEKEHAVEMFGAPWWIRSHCGNPKHVLIKLGRTTFHKTLSPAGWACQCPQCGKGWEDKKSRSPKPSP